MSEKVLEVEGTACAKARWMREPAGFQEMRGRGPCSWIVETRMLARGDMCPLKSSEPGYEGLF